MYTTEQWLYNSYIFNNKKVEAVYNSVVLPTELIHLALAMNRF